MGWEYSKLFVERIRALCMKRGISVNKLAEMSGVSQSTLDNLMNGKTFNPRIKTIHKIAIALSMTPAEFLDYKELNEYTFEDESEESISTV